MLLACCNLPGTGSLQYPVTANATCLGHPKWTLYAVRDFLWTQRQNSGQKYLGHSRRLHTDGPRLVVYLQVADLRPKRSKTSTRRVAKSFIATLSYACAEEVQTCDPVTDSLVRSTRLTTLAAQYSLFRSFSNFCCRALYMQNKLVALL